MGSSRNVLQVCPPTETSACYHRTSHAQHHKAITCNYWTNKELSHISYVRANTCLYLNVTFRGCSK